MNANKTATHIRKVFKDAKKRSLSTLIVNTLRSIAAQANWVYLQNGTVDEIEEQLEEVKVLLTTIKKLNSTKK